MVEQLIPPPPLPAQPPVPPNTTHQQDIIAASQRHINVKWESTQQVIAILVTADALLICTLIVWVGDSSLKLAAFLFVTNLAFLVVGTYFQRTNHTKTGGVQANETTR